jgi:CHAT domain-containing protein
MPKVCRRILEIAERDPRRGVLLADHLLARVAPGDLPGLAWAAYVGGWARICAEQVRSAEAQIEDALVRFESLGIAEPQPLCRYALAITSFFLRLDAGLANRLSSIVGELHVVGARQEAILAQTYLAAVYNILGRPNDAATLLGALDQELAEQDYLARGRLLRVRAVAASGSGELALALELFDGAEQIFRVLHLRIDLAKCWYERAAALMRQEQFEPALQLHSRAERLFRRSALPFRCALCAKDRGFAQLRLGRFDQAVPNLLRALTYFRSLGRVRDVAHCLLQLGNVLLSAGSWEAALTCFTRTEALCRTLGMSGDTLLHALINRVRVYRALRQPAVASVLLAEVDRLAARVGDEWLLAEVRHLFAALSADMRQHEQALRHYQSALQHYQDLGNIPGAAACLLDLAELLLQRGDYPAARRALLDALPLHGGQAELIWRCDYGLARCAERLESQQAALEHYQQACARLADLRWRLAGSEHSSQLYETAALLHTQALQLALAMGLDEAALALAEEQRALALQQALMLQRLRGPASAGDLFTALLTRIEQAEQLALQPDALVMPEHKEALDNDVLAAASERQFDLRQVREQLNRLHGDAWMVLAYVQVGEQLVTFIITASQISVEQQPYTAQLRRLVERATSPGYRQHTFQGEQDVPHPTAAAPWEPLGSLGQLLIPSQARQRLHAELRLLIVPCGQLHALAWPALRIDTGWLIERAVVQVVPALRVLQQLDAAPRSDNPTAVLLGCSDFGERAPVLLGITEELATIAAAMHPGWETTITHETTLAEFRQRSDRGELARCQLLHIASHAQLRAGTLHAAHIKLCDGDLTIDTIARLRLAGATVVLSACEGAASESLPGDEVISLGWAFLAAGAGGVIASLWPVYDRVAIRMMRQLYGQLNLGHDAARALALAQRAAIQEHTAHPDLLSSPLAWASFTLLGAGAASLD